MPDLTIKQRWWHPIIRRLAATSLGIWLLSGTLFRLDMPLLRWTGGRFSLTEFLAGLPVVVLHTIGARSGLPRKTPLAATGDGGRIILIATNFGSRLHPAWYHNLIRHPRVTLSYRGESADYIAFEAKRERREAFWHKAASAYPGYELYREKAGERQIPVIVLEPAT